MLMNSFGQYNVDIVLLFSFLLFHLIYINASGLTSLFLAEIYFKYVGSGQPEELFVKLTCCFSNVNNYQTDAMFQFFDLM